MTKYSGSSPQLLLANLQPADHLGGICYNINRRFQIPLRQQHLSRRAPTIVIGFNCTFWRACCHVRSRQLKNTDSKVKQKYPEVHYRQRHENRQMFVVTYSSKLSIIKLVVCFQPIVLHLHLETLEIQLTSVQAVVWPSRK